MTDYLDCVVRNSNFEFLLSQMKSKLAKNFYVAENNIIVFMEKSKY